MNNAAMNMCVYRSLQDSNFYFLQMNIPKFNYWLMWSGY